jgi:hypothetical protein
VSDPEELTPMAQEEPTESRALADNEVDDAFRALMEGLRTTLPGVQVLFAFLLTVPLQAGFAEFGAIDRGVFYLAFASSALASILLIAPSVHQRVRAPKSGLRRRTAHHVYVAAKIATVGTAIAAIAISAVTFLVTSLVFDNGFAALAAAVLMAVTAWSWFYLPLVQFERE